MIKSIELPIKGFVANDVNMLFMTSQVAGLIFLETNQITDIYRLVENSGLEEGAD